MNSVLIYNVENNNNKKKKENPMNGCVPKLSTGTDYLAFFKFKVTKK